MKFGKFEIDTEALVYILLAITMIASFFAPK